MIRLTQPNGNSLLVLFAVLAAAHLPAADGSPEGQPYADDPEIVKLIQAVPEGGSALLPEVRHLLDGQPIKLTGRSGPYSRDYTNRMAYAPDRQTALYCGGNHGMGRHNDVWEFHLGSNTWHCLFAAEGGDHATYKFALMFAPRMFEKNPDLKLDEKQQKNFDDCAVWWKENVILHEGNFVTKDRHGPLLVGHTWDTLVYDPIKKRLIQGTGAHCANSPWLHHKFTGENLDEIKAKFGKDKEGRPYRTMWTFDPNTRQWVPYAHESELSVLRGMGATMIYVPDLKKIVYYVAAQNVSPNALYMHAYDPATDTWENLKPNAGRGIFELAFKDKISPPSEQQTAYSTKDKKIVAVLHNTTFAYDVAKNEWSKLNDTVPLKASDAATVFAYDSNADIFLLCDPRNGKLAAYSLSANEWKEITPTGPAMPKPPYCVGKGYYDPAHNAFVVQPASSSKMWLYRHKQTVK
ncbi:MAG: hypothetical protein AMXMBFR7_22220 [Planctomycetota bacterium]